MRDPNTRLIIYSLKFLAMHKYFNPNGVSKHSNHIYKHSNHKTYFILTSHQASLITITQRKKLYAEVKLSFQSEAWILDPKGSASKFGLTYFDTEDPWCES